jgi:hypothetical protein
MMCISWNNGSSNLTVDVFAAVAAANIVNVSGFEGPCVIQICLTPASSAVPIVVTAAAAFIPSTTKHTRSRRSVGL